MNWNNPEMIQALYRAGWRRYFPKRPVQNKPMIDREKILAAIKELEPKERAAYAEYKRREVAIGVEPAKDAWLALYRELKGLKAALSTLETLEAKYEAEVANRP